MNPIESLEGTPAGVSVIICCYNSAPRLPETLKHLARQIVPPAIPWEVIVVNNASTDDTAVLAAFLWNQFGNPVPLRVLDEPTPGKSFALDAGYASAKYPVLVTVDDDNWLDPDYLRIAHEAVFANKAIGIVGGQSTAKCEVEPPAWFETMKSHMAVGRAAASPGDITDIKPHVAGAGMALRKSAYDELKRRGFRFSVTGPCQGKTGPDDMELCYAIALIGYRIWYDERLRFVHFIPAGRLVADYITNLTEQIDTAALLLMTYETALREPSVSPVTVYLRGVVKHFNWAFKSFAKLLMGRHSLTVFKIEVRGLWHSVTCLPEFLRVFNRYYPEIVRLRDTCLKR